MHSADDNRIEINCTTQRNSKVINSCKLLILKLIDFNPL